MYSKLIQEIIDKSDKVVVQPVPSLGNRLYNFRIKIHKSFKDVLFLFRKKDINDRFVFIFYKNFSYEGCLVTFELTRNIFFQNFMEFNLVRKNYISSEEEINEFIKLSHKLYEDENIYEISLNFKEYKKYRNLIDYADKIDSYIERNIISVNRIELSDDKKHFIITFTDKRV